MEKSDCDVPAAVGAGFNGNGLPHQADSAKVSAMHVDRSCGGTELAAVVNDRGMTRTASQMTGIGMTRTASQMTRDTNFTSSACIARSSTKPDFLESIMLNRVEMPGDLAPQLTTLALRMGALKPDEPVTAEMVMSVLPPSSLYPRKYLGEELPRIIAGLAHDARLRSLSRAAMRPDADLEKPCENAILPYSAFASALLNPDDKGLDKTRLILLQWIAKSLLSPDINTIVAESSQVSIWELVGHHQTIAKQSSFLEIVVTTLIIANGLLMGVRTSRNVASWPFWHVVEMSFTATFALEAAFKMWQNGPRDYFRGIDRRWNVLDFVIVLSGIVDIMLSSVADESISRLTIVRFVRLARLTRLTRVLRLSGLKELQIMVKGLFGGMRTLLWAIVLLFFFIYICGIIMTETVQSDDRAIHSDEVEYEMLHLFGSLPSSMITTFRCLIGDCATSQGKPLIGMLIDAFGATFALGYIMLVMLVTFGLFNLIMALYLENTLAAARQHETTAEAHVTVARDMKELLRLFYSAQQQRNTGVPLDADTYVPDEDVDCECPIERRTYMEAIESREVQRIMDRLEIESDRARLFDVIDADGNECLSVREVVQGFLRLRGEAQRSDVLASVLGVRAVLYKLRELSERSQSDFESGGIQAVLDKLRDVNRSLRKCGLQLPLQARNGSEGAQAASHG
eukprot:NODE_1864_length_2351_cov_6.124101.p1 GENE.NODE_1864_length_2351_cov_6.124101~~NODE_1864_length_2351_cov_6.124101.p1  ORF type:complete len:745 (-),score=184.61 NODE_1864_length_2351_cov_6.124101:116-2164(-)